MSQRPADRNLPLPWVDNPPPTSHIQPGVTHELKTFPVSMWYFPTHYPYRTHGRIRGPETQTRTVPFYLFVGIGPPPKDIGYPGDIYRDKTVRDYALYARFVNIWVPWTGRPTADDTIHEHSNLLHHPYLTAHFLWCTENGITWMWCEDILKDAEYNCIGLPVSVFPVNSLLARLDGLHWSCQTGQKRSTSDRLMTSEDDRVKRLRVGNGSSSDGKCLKTLNKYGMMFTTRGRSSCAS
jgi:hypothetical protein